MRAAARAGKLVGMTCDQLSVQRWLRDLRFTTESYDPGVPVAEGAQRAAPAARRASESSVQSASGSSESVGEVADRAGAAGPSGKFSEFGPADQASMEVEAGALARLSGSYENIWNCSSQVEGEMELKYGHICRVSFEFDEAVQELLLSPVVLTKFDFTIPTSILQWKSELMFECSSEEEENQEYASLERINEEKGKTSFNQTRPFPIEHTVEIRHNSETVRRGTYRSQTVHESAYGSSIEQQLKQFSGAEVDIKGVVRVCCDNSTKKLSKNQTLRLQGEQLVLVSDKGDEELLVDSFNQTQCKSAPKKKEVVIIKETDEACSLCKLQFDSTKDMNIALMDLGRSRRGDKSPPSPLSGERSKIRYNLLKLLVKRSSKDQLEKKGIIRNEPIFGNTLGHLHEMSKLKVPQFVTRIMQLIELSKNIKSVGLYRASGNLATIQKIRFHIDKNNLKILDEFKNDSDVLTGSLKLFFRELKKPLIPHKTYEELCRYIDADISPKTEEAVQKLVNKMEEPHQATLLALLKHLLKVESHAEENRMDAYNISIVWGPTLIWPPDNCHENILLSHTNANRVVELLLNVYRGIYENQRKHEPSPKIGRKADDDDVASEGVLLHSKNALKLQLEENLTHGLRRAASKENLIKSTESLTKSDHPRTPDKEVKFSLEALCAKEKVPEFVTKVITLIEKAINSEQLYKRRGSDETLEKIRKKIGKSRNHFGSIEKYNVHDLAWALKNFFSELNEPLIPRGVFNRLVIATDERLEVTKLRNTKRELTSAHIPHRETLDYLMRHLVNVSRHEEANKMSKHNIAMAWAPFLCRAFVENYQFSHGSCAHVLETLLQIYDSQAADSEQDPRRNVDIHNTIHREDNQLLGRSPDRHEWSLNQVLPSVLKRTPKISKNDSSLYRCSRYSPNTRSLYDNVHLQPAVENVKDEAVILETSDVRRTKL